MQKPIPFCLPLIALAVAACNPSPNSSSTPPAAPSSAPASPAPTVTAKGAKAATVESRVREIVAEQLGLSVDRVLQSSTWKDLGADSLDAVELIMAFEEEFNVEIPDEKAEAMRTVGDATSYMTKHGKL